ncbi:RNA-binding protein 38-like [Panicum virgatum]|uniref:RRM domain-containing protein n=1 Tax=Panicum virgatum TaxID=38727 RepID=A0A8T0T849_PANVG|nr:RNA-binding protein 38-like [Panicum virgatum]KAG2605425.1 hypothetical protein PVAP13_4NG074300 [Panicum virgatum]
MAAAPSSSSSASPAGGGGPRPYRSRFGDTTLTKVFVGGLAWETPSEGLRQHFERYGDILEAVVITDRVTGRSKGYGFVTFREPEAARRAVQDPNPTIAGRRANCNIASLGPPRPAQPRGRGPYAVGAHMQQVPQPAAQGPHFVPSRAPASPQMMPQHGGGPAAAIYPPHFGCWYPPDFQYPQPLANPQVLHNYYPQLYGMTSPTASPFHPYVGYMAPQAPRALLPPPPPAAQQVAVQALLQHPTPQIQGSFFPAPSLPHNFRLQLPPPQALSVLPPNTTESQPAEQAAASAARATNASSTAGA